MSQIRPVSDLRNKFAEISREAKENSDGVILTKNGYADMVVISYEAYTRRKFEEEVYLQLMEAELQAKNTTKRFAHEEVFSGLRSRIKEISEQSDV